MMLYRLASKVDSVARMATVLPAPTSPVITPMRRSVMHQPIRAVASPCAALRCSMPGARSRPKGGRVNPKKPCGGRSPSHLLAGEQVHLPGDLVVDVWVAAARAA